MALHHVKSGEPVDLQPLGPNLKNAKIAAVSPNTAVVHETIFEKDFLSALDIRLAEDDRSARINDLIRDRGCIVMHLDRQPDQYAKSDNHDSKHGASPPRRQSILGRT